MSRLLRDHQFGQHLHGKATRNRAQDLVYAKDFPGGSDGKESACSAGDLGWDDLLEDGMATHSSILAWRIPMDRGAWQVTVHGVANSWT